MSHSMIDEVQLTFGAYGHMLNSDQVFSPDGEWVVYDTRNDITHIGRTCCLEKVNIKTGEIVKLYASPDQTIHGPGVGAAAYNPLSNKIIFIHGLFNCTAEKPYGFTRRFGALLREENPKKIIHSEARTIQMPFIPGSLRGGTHAHTWSGDGKWISFTYNDFIMEKLGSEQGVVKDLRTIGVMAPQKKVLVPDENAENFSGEYFSVVTATVTETPKPGSDEIEKAFDECWIGKDGYMKKDGSRQKRAVAFQGHVRLDDGSLATEIFVTDIPDDITQALPGKPIEGSLTLRPGVPAGLHQRRVTFTASNKFPGVQGPRFWLRSSPDGQLLYFLMKDHNGIVQVFEVATRGGDPRQVTHYEESIETQFNLSPDGKKLTAIAGNCIWLTDVNNGKSRMLSAPSSEDDAPVLGVLWSNKGNLLVYNRFVNTGNARYLQIFRIDLN
ncbi:MAG: DUF3748 domain-containing protein [Cyclobacteriaceae bacterium]